MNGRRLSSADVARLERTYGVQVRPADDWYDRMTGAWGLRGGPTRGFIHPGRWWVLANGLVGREGDPALFNMSVCAGQGSGSGGGRTARGRAVGP